MSAPVLGLEALRREFDEAFGLPRALAPEARLDFLAIRVGGAPYALGMAGLAALERLKRVQPLPGAAPGLLGLAGARGRLVPVFSLAALLGQGEAGELRWLAVVGREEPVGLAFAELEAYLRVGPGDLAPAESSAGRPWLKAGPGEGGRPVVEPAALLDELCNRPGLRAPS